MLERIARGAVALAICLIASGTAGTTHAADTDPTDPTDPIDPTVCHISAIPGEVPGVRFDDLQTLGWDPGPCATFYNVYRGSIADLRAGTPSRCHARGLEPELLTTPTAPDLTDSFFYIVTGVATAGEGTPGDDSFEVERRTLATCASQLRAHVLNRVTYGADEWTRDRLDLLGTQAFVNEQLDPASIDEATNTALIAARTDIDPPESLSEAQSLNIVNAVYARRQLEQQVAMFWSNHFNTWYKETSSFFNNRISDALERRRVSILQHYNDLERFRDTAFNGTFREILEESALQPAMMIFLDTVDSLASSPNENFPREVIELYTTGITNGVDTTIEELAKVFTGWTVCKKAPGDLTDPLAPCIADPEDPLMPGEWVPHFRVDEHRCEAKTLFTETGNPTVIPDTCADPALGLNDAFLALDALASHPSTAPFISTRLLERFVTESPTPEMVSDIVAVWNDPSNPQGVGDLREVLRAVLNHSAAREPDHVGGKVKTPLELIASGFRAVRGQTVGNFAVREYMRRMRHSLHDNPVPTGFPEDGDEWIDTSNLLERESFAIDMTSRTGSNFGADVIGLLQDNGISTAPGNEEAIVDFFIDVLYRGALPEPDRAEAIDFLITDDDGNPDPSYNWARIRNTVGLLMSLGHFQYQ